MKRRSIRIVGALLSAMMCVSQASVTTAAYAPPSPAQKIQESGRRAAIAVYRITGANIEVERMATSALTTAVGRLSAARPVERLKLRHALSEEVLRREGIARPAGRAFGGVNGADYLIVGEADFTQNAAWTRGGGTCQLHLRLVDTYTGNVVTAWTSRGISLGGDAHRSIAYAAQYAADHIAKLFPARGQVMAIDGELLYLNLTVADDAARGDTVLIYPKPFTTKDPATGDEVVIRGRHIRGKIVESSPEYCVAKIDKKFMSLLHGEEIVELRK